MNNLLWLNAEFQKSLWLELTLGRLIAGPIIIGLIALALSTFPAHAGSDAMILILEIMVIIWGSRMATDSITEELAMRTWDVHRLSASRATGLVLGKFFGGTSFAWYLGGMAAAVSLYLVPGSRADVIDTCVTGLLAQSAAFFCAIALRSGSSSRRVHNLVSQAIGLAIAFGLRKGVALVALEHTEITWFGRVYTPLDFFDALSVIAFAWFIVGAIRLIRRDLGFRDGPAGWSLFVVFLSVLGAGFWSQGQIMSYLSSTTQLIRETSSVLLAVGATYVALLGTPILSNRLSRLWLSLRTGQPMKAWRDMPPWIPGFILCLIAAGAAELRYPGHLPFYVALLGLLARDIVVVAGLRLSLQSRAEPFVTAWFVIVYGIGWYILRHTNWHDLPLPTGDITFPMALAPWGEMLAAMLIFSLGLRRLLRTKPVDSPASFPSGP
jgi:hypothetical protein